MDAESFFAKWSRRKGQAGQDGETAHQPASSELQPAQPAQPTKPTKPTKPTADTRSREPEPPRPPPTLEDVATLTPDSDYARFVAPGVDDNVKRSALKKLFADPHYNIMDGLDTYIEDYNKFEPIPPGMLAKLQHAKALLDPLSHLSKPLSRLMDRMPESEAALPEADPKGGNKATATDTDAAAAAAAGKPVDVTAEVSEEAGPPETGLAAAVPESPDINHANDTEQSGAAQHAEPPPPARNP